MDLRNGASAGEKVDPNEGKVPQKTFRTALPQILATMAKNLILLTYGMTLGFPTIVIPALSEAPVNATLHLSKEEVSWFGSINLITVPLGCLVSGVVTQPFGRKRSMQFLTLPFFAVWIMFYYADSVAMLYASLALTGLAGGLLEAPVLTYVAEITQPHLRGFLSATSSLSVIIGIFTQFLMGTFIDWRTLSLVNSALPIMAFIALCFIPESPHWLIGMNRLDDAEKSLCWLRGWVKPSEVKEELQVVKVAVRESHTVVHTGGIMEKIKTSCHKFSRRTFVRPFLLVVGCFFIGNFTGVSSLSTFAVSIFASLGSPIDKYYATCLLGAAQMIGSLSCAGIIHYSGKRPLVIISSIGQSILFASVSFYAYFYAKVMTLDDGAAIKATFADTPNSLSWVPLVGLIGGALCAYCGARLLPWLIIGEIFPADIRALASGIAASAFYIFGFAANKTYFSFVDTFTIPGVYWLHSSVALAAAVFYYFFLPETEGWQLYEIEEHFAGKRNLIHAGKKKPSCDKKGLDNLGISLNEVNKA